METEVRTVLVTAPDAQLAESMARTLVEERLAACVNVIPGLVSVYRWEAGVQRDQEALMILKTTQSRIGPLRERIMQLHSYEVPEFLVLPVVDGHQTYLGWVRDAVGDTHG